MLRRLLVTLLLFAALVGCTTSAEEPASTPSPTTVDESKPHSHGPGNEHISVLVGDGTRASEVGYTMADASLPKEAGVPGTVRFHVTRYDGSTLRDYIPEQTKDLHLYLVRTDYAVFRHLHPTIDQQGVWSAPVTLPEPGDYRVIAEFVARDEGGNGDFLMLGSTATIPGDWSRDPVDPPKMSDDGIVNVAAVGSAHVGRSGSLDIRVRDAQGRPVKLGTYLGAFAHMTAFQLDSGVVVHLHPLGQPETHEDGTVLRFHTQFEQSGDYLAFVQVRVDGFLHTLPVAVEVA